MSSIEDLQSQIAFQEDMIQKLDAALGEQQQELLALKRVIRELTQQIRQIESVQPEDTDQTPPHY